MPLPIPRPISGKRFAPKIRMMIARIMMSSGMPSRPNMVQPFLFVRRADSTTLLRAPRFGGAGPDRAPRFGAAGWTPGPWLLAGLFLCLAGLPIGGAGASAQFTSGVNVVEVYAAATDRDGNPVTGLRREDFTVLEEGQPQPISAFTEGDFPLSVALGLDRSFSMG